MNIKSAKFVKGIIGTNDILYDGKFQVAFIGRSNVGKSSLINSLVKKSKLARSSSSPGKTIRMDFFLINDKFYFVDLPGYGYATRSMGGREKLAKMILWYLLYSEVKNRLVILIIDAKVGVTAYDKDMLKALNEQNLDHIIVANKIDNLERNLREKQLDYLQSEYSNSQVVPYSAKEKFGREELMGRISSFIGNKKNPS
ncbi:YihA family ribosome biogenesis GTP-binding protein [Candidatus Gottesmanbacteria bacterium]|nr:YihA family ribosome biogenesis GTP-binding protein [Candidatus Gottesmanbacteria bacterium]